MKAFIITTIIILALSIATFFAWGGFSNGFGCYLIALTDCLLITIAHDKFVGQKAKK